MEGEVKEMVIVIGIIVEGEVIVYYFFEMVCRYGVVVL